MEKKVSIKQTNNLFSINFKKVLPIYLQKNYQEEDNYILLDKKLALDDAFKEGI